MPDFYDYDMIVNYRGEEVYALRRNTRILGDRAFCTIKVHTYDNGTVYYARTTQWHSKNGRRVEVFSDLDKAMRSGVEWAIRRRKQDAS